MPNKKYDEIIKLPMDKLAQTMSDITYNFKETRVPKQHYKKVLGEVIEQELSLQLDFTLLNVYVDTFKRIKEDNPKLFFQALICIEENVKLSKNGIRPNEYQALEHAYNHYLDTIKNGFINENIKDVYYDTLENGTLNNEQVELIENLDLDKEEEEFEHETEMELS